jgi:hypothetical protein
MDKNYAGYWPSLALVSFIAIKQTVQANMHCSVHILYGK